MKIEWVIESQEIDRVKAFVAEHVDSPFVQNRIKRNLRSKKPPVSKAEVWETHIGCLLTTQQRSGPKSAVSRFISKPFPLSYDACCQKSDVEAFCHAVLKEFGGIRRSSVISREIAANFDFLSSGGWQPTLKHLEAVRLESSPDTERRAADFLADHLKGIGPKQSRNLLQWLGLSRFETPIDSRITRWLNAFGFPLKLAAPALADRNYYNFVSEGFQELSTACGIEPCVLDAVIFASYDGNAWTEDNVGG